MTTPVRDSTGQWLAGDRITVDSFAEVMREWLSRDAACRRDTGRR